MVFITAEVYKNAEVDVITVKNKDYFWVNMKDVQNNLGIKNMTQHIKGELCGKLETKEVTEEQKNRYVRTEYQITKIKRDSKKEKFVKYKVN